MHVEAVRAELHSIYRAHGVCTPQLVVDSASEPSSPLHSLFTWDDEAAAAAHRLDQARQLIRKVKIWIDRPDGPIQVRAFVNVSAGPEGERTYMPVEDAMADEATRKLVLRRAWQEMVAFRRRYEGLEECSRVIAAIDEVIAS
jgi:hypothetical protein